ncbi:MAG: CPBP family intramembrane metalloprotease [Pirellulales bacterium]|nr:CPBP family intramembrane metalloprotease [Pirellulales bacterium]
MSTTVAATSAAPLHMARNYWDESRAPLTSLLFVLPMLLGYELGGAYLGRDAWRSGAEVWLNAVIAQSGFAGRWLVPVATVVALLAWHHASGRRWNVSALVLLTMLAETVAWAAGLVAAAHAQLDLVARMSAQELLPAAGILEQYAAGRALSQVVLYLGAGLYEEFLFRLALLPVLAWALQNLGSQPRARAWFLAAVLSTLVFAAAHYIGPYGDAWAWPTFAVRLLAGGFFAALFVLRGFGIAAGAHALYDIWVGCIG